MTKHTQIAPSNFHLRKGRLEMDPPLTLSHIQKLTQLTVSTHLNCDLDSGLCVDSLIPGIISLVATSPSLKCLILRTTISPWRFDISALPDFCRPLVSLVDHPSLEHIELRIITVAMKGQDELSQELVSDVTLSLMEVPELKMLCNKGFLSVGGLEFEGWFD